ncbi:MAG TPA: tRNA pseudouridine(38-40) synthase TruA [Myxococcaceae bacterium]|nr:tRNA pseudouridine(38-40) synthase TruA [Myxococcaceae bacterium]
MRRRRLALWVWYRGAPFQGWQSQRTGRSVQETLVAALSTHGVSGAPMASGRTDRGVHARCQPVSLRAPPALAPEVLADLGGEAWGVAAVVDAPRGFHAQWSSAWKEYRYRLGTGPVPANWRGLVWETATHPRLVGRTIELARVRWALQRAVGTRDFAALHAPSSVRRPRTLEHVSWWERDGVVEVALRADAFGRYGVRLLVGGAVLVGAGLASEATWERALDSAAPFEGLRAPAAGLTLWEVGYPAQLDPFAGLAPRLPGVPPFVPLDQAWGGTP